MRGVLDRVQSNGQHLLGLINDVLDLSKIEAGQLTLSLSDYSLKDVVQSVFTAVEPLATEKQLALKFELPPELPRGRGDERRLAQVLLNLVGNAIKFTDAGEVAIKASATNGSFNVAVRDTGPGISASRPGQDFRGVPAGRQFEHQEEGRHRARLGHRQAHHRDAWRPHLGRSRARGRARPSHSRFRSRSTTGGARMSKRILVVEDQEDNRQILRDLLANAGYRHDRGRRRRGGARGRGSRAAGSDPHGHPAARSSTATRRRGGSRPIRR